AFTKNYVVAELETGLREISSMRAADNHRNPEFRANLCGEFARLVRPSAERRETDQIRLCDPAPLRGLDVLHVYLHVVTRIGENCAHERHAIVRHHQTVGEVRKITTQL